MNLARTIPAFLLAALAGASATTLAGPTTVTLVADLDTVMFEDPEGTLSNAKGPNLHVAVLRAGGTQRRALVHFDLSSLPRGITVQSASVILHQNNSSNAPEEGFPVHLHRVNATWGEGTSDSGEPGGFGAQATEGDATWIHSNFPSVNWTTPGGDYVSTPSASTPVSFAVEDFTWSSQGIVDDVAAWVEDEASNFGWIVITEQPETHIGHRFNSREAFDETVRPRLTIVYTGGIEPGCNLADVTEVGGTTENPGNPDGQLTVDDLILFVNFFSDQTGCPGAGPCNPADVTGIGGFGSPPDGELTIDDLIEFVNAFSEGC